MTIPVPPLAVQERIANAVSAYDDLIENNRRRMALLEESARLLYQEWFVHLRFPGHEHVRVVNGVPEGWDAEIIQDFYKTASGGTPSRTVPEYFTGDIPWVKTQELPNGFILDTDEKITEDAVKYSSAKIFPNRTLLVALYGATVGEVGILSMEAATNQACCAVMPKDDRAHFVHSYLFFRENKSQLMALSAGAAQNNISQQIIREYKMVMPPKSLMSVFTGALEPAFGQSLNLARQNEKLRAARDLLLPRLMSGEVAV
jgi:type I restriction enzyme S subunit